MTCAWDLGRSFYKSNIFFFLVIYFLFFKIDSRGGGRVHLHILPRRQISGNLRNNYIHYIESFICYMYLFLLFMEIRSIYIISFISWNAKPRNKKQATKMYK